MRGDYSRLSFDRKKRYSAVLMQQGRLQLDADWNEQVQISEHRNTALFRDLVGRSGTPQGKPMVLAQAGGALHLTPGAYYIDGLLAEQTSEVPTPLELPGDGAFLCVLDVWTREVDAIEDEALMESSVGVETTTRLKTEWAIRYVPSTPEILAREQAYRAGNWPVLSDAWRPLGPGKLSLGALEVNAKDNRLYRIEVHRSPASPDFFLKWSADNASIRAEVSLDESLQLTLKNNSPEERNAFRSSAWIELSTLGPEAQGGGLKYMFNMAQEGNVLHEGSGTFTLTQPAGMDADVFRQRLEALPAEGLKLKICRWDGIFEWGNTRGLEEALGLGVGYSPSEAPVCRDGDYWHLLIRDGQVTNWARGEAKEADGIEHHFAALGFLEVRDGAVAALDPLSVIFEPLASRDLSTSQNLTLGGELSVSHIAGDTSIGGRLGLGLPSTQPLNEAGFPQARLTMTPSADGRFISFHNPLGEEIGSLECKDKGLIFRYPGDLVDAWHHYKREEAAERRQQIQMRSLIGRSGTPRDMEMRLEEEITSNERTLVLREGVYYIDGLLIENPAPLRVPAFYSSYSYYSHLYYIEAWTREVDALDEPSFMDPLVALKAARFKTEWAVRVIWVYTDSLVSGLYEGLWPFGYYWWGIPSTRAKLQLSSETLNVQVQEDRLYRIEVCALPMWSEDNRYYHDTLGLHRFRWSRDNASVCVEVVLNDDFSFSLKSSHADLEQALQGAAWIELSYSAELVWQLEGSWERDIWTHGPIPYETLLMCDMSEEGNRLQNGRFYPAFFYEMNSLPALEWIRKYLGWFDPEEDFSEFSPEDIQLYEEDLAWFKDEFRRAFKENCKIVIRRWDGVFPPIKGPEQGDDYEEEENYPNSLEEELGVAFKYTPTWQITNNPNDWDEFRDRDYWHVLVSKGQIVNWKPGEYKQPDGYVSHFAGLGIMTANGLQPVHRVFDPLTNIG